MAGQPLHVVPRRHVHAPLAIDVRAAHLWQADSRGRYAVRAQAVLVGRAGHARRGMMGAALDMPPPPESGTAAGRQRRGPYVSISVISEAINKEKRQKTPTAR